MMSNFHVNIDFYILKVHLVKWLQKEFAYRAQC